LTRLPLMVWAMSFIFVGELVAMVTLVAMLTIGQH
jgi:hypothetical protein